jgi:hypothetical protein
MAADWLRALCYTAFRREIATGQPEPPFFQKRFPPKGGTTIGGISMAALSTAVLFTVNAETDFVLFGLRL